MKLKILIEQYIDYRKSLGEKFRTNSDYLRTFYRYVGEDVSVNRITIKKVNAFLYGNNKLTSTWFVKHTALLGFYTYATSRGYVKASPLPKILPKRPPNFVPYIYTKQELKLLLDTALTYKTKKGYIEPYVVRIILLLLYSTGLRISEVLNLLIEDVNLSETVITVNATKFYKARLVPFNQQLLKIINEYLGWRKKEIGKQYDKAPLFVSLKNQPINTKTIRSIFQRIRSKSGIKRTDNASYQPRIHDIRHSFAVHRLTSWYQENKDVQKLLPVLSTYMGHTYLGATSVYLKMTDDLLHEANLRFQQYAIGELQ
jgi:site-specific recombinase XerD